MTAYKQTSAAYISSIKKLADLSDSELMAWNELSENAEWTGVFQRPDMVMALGGSQTQVLSIVQGSILKLILPFEIRKKSGTRVLVMPGDGITQYSSIVCSTNHETKELIAEAIAAIKQHDVCDALYLSNVAEHAPLFASPHMRAVRVASRQTVFLPLSDYINGKAYAPHGPFSPKKMRWSERRLQEMGNHEYHRFEAGKAPVEWVEKAVALKLQWLKDKGDTSRLFANAELRKKFVALFVSIKNTPAVCHALTVEGKPIAVHLAFETQKASHLYFTVYDPEHSKYSPSAVLTLHQISGNIADKVEIFDFMPPFYDYKMKWCDKTMNVYDVFLPFSTKARFGIFGLKTKLKPKLRPLFDILPKALRRAIVTLVGQFTDR